MSSANAREYKRFLVFLGAFMCFAVLVSPAWSGDITVTLTAPSYSLSKVDNMDRIAIPGFGTLDEPGAPAVPVGAQWVVLPPNALGTAVEIAVIEKQTEEIPGAIQLAPAPPFLSTSDSMPLWGGDKSIVEGKDMAVYGLDSLFPEEAVRAGSVVSARGYRMVQIRYFPVQYNPMTGKALWTRELRIRIHFNEIPVSAVGTTAAAKTTDTRFLPGPILNPASLQDWYGGGGMVPMELTGDGYAIVTTDAVKDTLYEDGNGDPDPNSILYRFSDHKNGLGLTVYLVTETECVLHGTAGAESGYGSDQGQQRAVNVRTWLQNNHGSPQKNIRYVLLVGDADPDDPGDSGDSYGDLPMMMCYPNHYSPTITEAPTDYFFAELTGNWDLDGDGRFGEYDDDFGTGGVEFTPEVYVGRIPFSDGPRVTSVLQKTMDYENVTYSEGDNSTLKWRKMALLPMSILNHGYAAMYCGGSYKTTDDAYLGLSAEKHALNPKGFDTWLLTEKEGDGRNETGLMMSTSDVEGEGPLSKDSRDPESETKYLYDHWNASKLFGIVFWSLHGNSTTIAHRVYKYANPHGSCPSDKTYFGASSVSYLDDQFPAFTISDSCHIGRPEYSANLGLKLLERGALVSMACTRAGLYEVGNFSKESLGYAPKPIHLADGRITTYYYAEQLALDRPAGEAFFYAKQSKSLSAFSCVNNFGQNIYGDPSVKILPPGFTAADTDGDGLTDDEERYIYLSAPGLADTDGDGFDDGEELVYLEGHWTDDLDGDGLDIFHDDDTDGDGLTDYVEILTLQTAPRDMDTDDDGLSDYYEVTRDGDPGDYSVGTDYNPLDPDTDDDGVNDGDEVAAGDDPLDPWDNKPVAVVGPEQWVDATSGGETLVQLDGSQSMHPKGETLFYSWSSGSMSEYSPIEPNNSTDAAQPVLHAKVGGDFEVSLKVRKDPPEDYVWSDTVTVMIHVQHLISGISPEGAGWGDTLTIYGWGFDKDVSQNTVTIGGTPATVTTAAYDELQVTIPEGCAPGDVIVTVNEKASDPYPSGISLPPGSFILAPAGSLPDHEQCSMAAAMGDVDGDGDRDIVVANMGGLTEEETEYEDVLCHSMDPQNRLYLNDGAGHFTDMTFGPDGVPGNEDDLLPEDTDQSIDVKLVDVDGDEDLDIVFANHGGFKKVWYEWGGYQCVFSGGRSRLYINDGIGNFTDETDSRLPEFYDQTFQVAVGDIDGDNHVDLIFANGEDCVPYPYSLRPYNEDECCWECEACNDPWFSCDDCPNCALCTDCEWIDCENNPNHPCCNGYCDPCYEGAPCVVCCNGSCDSCTNCCYDCNDCPDNPGCQPYSVPEPGMDRFFLNDGTGHFTDVTDTSVSTDQYGRTHNGGRTRAIALGDMDGDEDLDLVRCGYSSDYPRTWLYENTGGFFELVEPYLSSESNVMDILLVNFDLDAEDTLDIFAPQDYDYPIYLAQEDGSFVDHSHYGSEDWLPSTLVYSADYRYWTCGLTGDVDLDGDQDILIGRKDLSQNLLLTNNDDEPGHLNYVAGMLPASAESSYGLVLGDVDNDGAPDLFYANVGTNTLLLNNTDAAFSCAGDLEPDGDVDGADLATWIIDDQGVPLDEFAANFGRADCP